MNSPQESKAHESSELNSSEIRLSLNPEINNPKTQDLTAMLNQLSLIALSHIPKGPQLNRFHSILSNISELLNKQTQPNNSAKQKYQNDHAQQTKILKIESNADSDFRATFDKEITQPKPKRPFARQSFSARGKLPQSLKKRDRVQQNTDQMIEVTQVAKSTAKYTRFIPALRVRSPEPQSTTKSLHKQQNN